MVKDLDRKNLLTTSVTQRSQKAKVIITELDDTIENITKKSRQVHAEQEAFKVELEAAKIEAEQNGNDANSAMMIDPMTHEVVDERERRAKRYGKTTTFIKYLQPYPNRPARTKLGMGGFRHR